MVRGDGSVEVQFARKLAGNDRTGRDRALRKLRKWLETRSGSSTEPVMSEVELLRLWKGLFYCMWMSDKPLVQEQLAEQLTQLTGCMTSLEDALAFAGAGFATMRREWNAIDSVRRDKFMMLVRRLLRQSLLVVAERRWSSTAVSSLLDMYRREFIRPEHKQLPVGLQLHLLDIYLEELAKVSRGDILPSMCLQMLQPFVELLKTTADSRLLSGTIRSVFRQLMKQSDPGLAYENASEDNSDDDEEEVNSDDDEEEAMLNGDADSSDDDAAQDPGSKTGDAAQDPGPMDPRAGGVDVILPQLRVDYGELAQRLITAGGDPTVRQHNRNILYKLAQQCSQVEAGEYPMAVRVPDGALDSDSDISEDEIEAAVQRIQEHKAQLNADSRKVRKRMRKTLSDDDSAAATSLKKRKLQEEASESVVAEEEQEQNSSSVKVKKKKVRDRTARGDIVELNVVNGERKGSSSPFVESAEQTESFLSPVRKKKSGKSLQSEEVPSEEPAVSPVRKKKSRKSLQSEEVPSEEPAVSPVRKKKSRKSLQLEEVPSEEPAVSPVRKKKSRKSLQSEEVPSEEPAVSPVRKKKSRKSLQSEEVPSEEPAVSPVRKKKSRKSLQSEEVPSEEPAEASVAASSVVKRRKKLQNGDMSVNGECELSEGESVMNGKAKKKRKERLVPVSAERGDSSETVSGGMNGHVGQENDVSSMSADLPAIVASAGSDTSAVISKKKRHRQSVDPLRNGSPAHSPMVNGAGHSEQFNNSPSPRGKSKNVEGATANGDNAHTVDEIGVDALSGEAEVSSPKSAKKAKKLLKKRARSGETVVSGVESEDSSATVVSAQTTPSPTRRRSAGLEDAAASAPSAGSHTRLGRAKRKISAAEGAGSVEGAVVEAVVGRASVAGDWCLAGQDDWGDAMEAKEAPVVGDVSLWRPAMRRPDPLPTLTTGSLTKKMKKRSKSNPGTPRTPATPGNKKVNINLSRNTAQAFKEHLMTVRNSPQTPHNPDKLPVKGLLKPFTPNPSSSGKKKRFTAADFF